jgi:hypothetical protein
MNDISDKIIKISVQYLGPAAVVLLERQTKFHMDGLEFKDIKQEHLPKLFYWVKVSSALVIKEKSEALVSDLMKEFNVSDVGK